MNLTPKKVKGMSEGIKAQLMIDGTISRHWKRRNIGLAMAWIDSRKLYSREWEQRVRTDPKLFYFFFKKNLFIFSGNIFYTFSKKHIC